MWTQWPGYLSLTTWILLQVPSIVVCGLRNKTACYNFMLTLDPPCAATEMLLPTMFTLGWPSDATCHREIAEDSLRQKGTDEIRRCCQQRESDKVTEYCLPVMKNQLTDHYYLDFVNTCTASSKCQLSSPGGKVQHTNGEDYVTFTFECVHTDTVLHIQNDSTYTGQEVYLYNDQHDGMAKANCIAYSQECDSHVIIQLAATRVVSSACQVDFTDGGVPIRKVDCKNPPASSNCSSTMFESKSSYVNMSIFMTVDPGRQEKEFLWMRAKTDTGKNVTVVCGASVPSDVSLNCPTSTSTTTTSTSTTTPTTTTPTTTATSTTSVKQAAMASTNTVSTQKAGKSQAFPSTITTSSRTSVHSKGTTTLSASIENGVFKSTPPHQSKSNSPSPHPSQHPSGSIGSFETSSPTDHDIPISETTKERISSTPSKESSSPKIIDISTPTKEPKHSTPSKGKSKDVFIIGGSVGGAVVIAVLVTITVCVRRRKRNSAEKTDQKLEILDERQENGNNSDGVWNSDEDNGYMSNPIYSSTDDYKMEQLQRKSCGDDACGRENVSPYAVSAPARTSLSLGKNSWVTQSKLDYFDILFNAKPSGEDSEERSDVQVSDLYAKVNKPQGIDQVTDMYSKVDKSRKTVRRTSAGEGVSDDISAMYAKVQK
ncbi:serine-rich adhesin for platelets-like isoform X2 [Haliotis asinina]|uniref:serine-rich adhesin for platelets-like isoform X2 n=1 Tax=Haliotis asinina TaxID=109174 RepID=UPI003531CC4B